MLQRKSGPETNMSPESKGFVGGKWTSCVDVRDFIQKNVSPYEGNHEFLTTPSQKTLKLWSIVKDLLKQETASGGVLDVDTSRPSGIESHGPGYIAKDLEVIVGLQTDKPLRRAIMPYGGIRLVEKACEVYGYELPASLVETFHKHRKTHNEAVFDLYTSSIKAARSSGIITGLPDAYGRGRIIGDYRRVPLYGVDFLIDDKQSQLNSLELDNLDEASLRLREELAEQIKSLQALISMASTYGFDISRPAQNTQEAIQWLYFAYLAAVKEQNGAAMSLGRVSSFLDIYATRDLKLGLFEEHHIQEMIDQFVMKLRMVRFLRIPEYDELFSGDPTWVTESIGGMGTDGRTLVTKMSFRFLHTLQNLGPAPEPNLTVLWSDRLPKAFKAYCAQVSIESSSIQYENDDLMRDEYGDDYGIACCVSGMQIGKQMQFFGARCNLAKTLLYAINGGRDEKTGKQIGPKFAPITSEILDYDEVMQQYHLLEDWLAKVYINALNCIHYSHDKYAYERLQMSLHDRDVVRTMACGIAGLSVVADSLSAIKYAKVKAIRNSEGIAIDFNIEGEFPKFGNNDPRVDDLAISLMESFMKRIERNQAYRGAIPTQSVLTITSNVVYGKKTGNTPDGRKAGEHFAPGANPMHARDTRGALASMSSVAKLPYQYAKDGISYTFSIEPNTLGKEAKSKQHNLVTLLDTYFSRNGHHININVLNREMLLDAMKHPESYPQLTIRVSGYAVLFSRLTKEQQLDVVSRTFHGKV